MRTKHKPNKSTLKRFKVTGTGKLKMQRVKRRHLLSGRSGDMLRRLARPGILDETHAKPIRANIGHAGKNPAKIAHLKKLAMQKKAAEAGESE
jgi:large subunit ribosomal protein L35